MKRVAAGDRLTGDRNRQAQREKEKRRVEEKRF